MTERREEEAASELARGGSADHDRAGRRGALQPGGDVHRVTERDRMTFGRTDDADCHLSAVDANTHVEIQLPGLSHGFRVALDRLDNAQRSAG